MRRRTTGARVARFLVLAGLAGLALVSATLLVRDGRPDCSALPPVSLAERALADHPATQRLVEAVHPRYTQVSAGPVKGCAGRGRIEILHASENDGRRIRQLLGDSFHGVPYRLVNI